MTFRPIQRQLYIFFLMFNYAMTYFIYLQILNIQVMNKIVFTDPAEAPPLLQECHLTIRPGYQGYGCNIRTFEDPLELKYHYVSNVNPGSPAEASGIKVGHRLIEVNGQNVTHDHHKEASIYLLFHCSNCDKQSCLKINEISLYPSLWLHSVASHSK